MATRGLWSTMNSVETNAQTTTRTSPATEEDRPPRRKTVKSNRPVNRADRRAYSRIGWAIARCLVGLASTCFFLFFLVGSLQQFQQLQTTRTLVQNGQILEFTFESISQERRVAVSYALLGKNITLDHSIPQIYAEAGSTEGGFLGEFVTDFDGVNDYRDYLHAQSVADSYVSQVLAIAMTFANTTVRTQTLQFFASLPRLREGLHNDTLDVNTAFMEYTKGIQYLWLLWSHESHTPSADMNRVLNNDLQLHTMLESLRYERDYIAFMTTCLINEQYNDDTLATAAHDYGGIIAKKIVYRDLFLTYAVEAQEKYYYDLVNTQEFALANSTYINASGLFVQAIHNTSNVMNLPTVYDWLNISTNVIRILKNLDLQNLEPIQDAYLQRDARSAYSMLSLAIVGSVAEILTAISIIYLALPVIKAIQQLRQINVNDVATSVPHPQQERSHLTV